MGRINLDGPEMKRLGQLAHFCADQNTLLERIDLFATEAKRHGFTQGCGDGRDFCQGPHLRRQLLISMMISRSKVGKVESSFICSGLI
jgi:hypothetical protein